MVRNLKDLGVNLQKITKRLMANDNLVKLLYYTDNDPLNHSNLSDTAKQKEIFEKLIRVVPYVPHTEESQSIVGIRVDRGDRISENSEFNRITFTIDVICPLNQWIIKNSNLRPFAILGEVQESLEGKTINGLGRITGGPFDNPLVTNEMTVYSQEFYITSYV